MTKTSIKRSVALLCSSLVFSTSVCAGDVDLNDALGEIFNGMANVTQPGAYELQRRGVVAGGGMTVRGQVVNTQLMTFTPPSWKAGCGGIDLYLGSFSYINADQFIELLRAVAANAAGYAFEVALDNVCPQCLVVMNSLQKGMQQLNQYAGNSCQLAKGIVTEGAELLGMQTRNAMGLSAMAEGLKDDWMATYNDAKKQLEETYQQNKPQEFARKYTGNIVWQVSKHNNLASWIFSGTGGDASLEMLMSLTGTVVIEALQKADPKDDKVMPKTTYPNILKLKHFVEGSEGVPVEIYECTDDKGADQCLKMVKKTQTVQGLKTLITRALIGHDGEVGMIDYWSNPLYQNQEPSLMQRNIVAALPLGMGAKLRDLAIHSPQTAATIAENASGAMATHMAIEASVQLINAAQIAMVQMDDAKRGQMSPIFKKTLDDLERDHRLLLAKYGSASQQLQIAWDVLAMTEKAKLVMMDSAYKPNTNTK